MGEKTEGESCSWHATASTVQCLSLLSLLLFQVTNAQFPDAMRKLKTCCQLYVSIDASNAVSCTRLGPLPAICSPGLPTYAPLLLTHRRLQLPPSKLGEPQAD